MTARGRSAEASGDGSGYALLDAGDGRRLERFGPRVVDRPAPTAVDARQDPWAWRVADLRFEGGRGWTGTVEVESWTVVLDGLTLELRPTASGGLGLYPEHAANLAWVAARIAERLESRRAAGAAGTAREAGAAGAAGPAGDAGPAGEAPRVLNLFAHTGLLTLAAARAGASVTHVDAARGAVAWARRNAELSDLADRPVRWLVDDAGGFVAREARRGRSYDGFILDPPSFGRSGRRQWSIADELPGLLAGCRSVAADDAFVLLTAHTTGLDGHALRDLVRGAFGPRRSIEAVPLELRAKGGAVLALGWAARLAGS